MSRWIFLAAAAALLFVLVVGIERHRNCRYDTNVHCELFGVGIGKYGGPR